MNELLTLITAFETRNNLNISILMFGDGSGTVNHYWDDALIRRFENIEQLRAFLVNTRYKLTDDGKCLLPLEIIK